jgi:hypothetical protein
MINHGRSFMEGGLLNDAMTSRNRAMSPCMLIAALAVPAQMEAVRERAKALGRIEFAYEGEFERLIDHRPPSNTPPRHSFSGRVTIDATQPIIVKEHHQPQGETLSINRISFTPTYRLLIQSLQNQREPLSQSKLPGGFLGAVSDYPHSIGAWFPTASFTIAADAESKDFVHLGEEEREGRRCLVLAHRYVTREYKFWIDLERNGLVLAAQYRQKDRLTASMRCRDVKLHRAKDRSVWLPTAVVTETHSIRDAKTKKWEPTATPSGRWTTRIVEDTLKIDDEAPRPTEIKFDRKEPIQDYMVRKPPAGPRSVHGPPPPVHKSPSREEVKQTITEADVQVAELQATLRPPPVDWMQRIAWSLVAIGVFGAGYVWYRNLRAGG